ncbi:MAG: molecular chaperone HtpG [Firmicutes bacterium]|nr:molecular chaperone HtpG [Bacillota bacterium]MDY3091534.1 molecular chaperone HtpG [Erysipelotrichaceae bacterium]
MAIKQFKTESKRLLDLMANSIYTNKEIFLRELISNASDALDKRHYLSLTDTNVSDADAHISITVDKENRNLIIEDNGIGMNKEDLENNLGTIAKSGSLEFKKELDDKSDIDIIGQFGVGFYSAFMVADRIDVLSRKVGEDKAYEWISESEEGYEIKSAKKDEPGTIITLHLKADDDNTKYSEYLDNYHIQSLIKKYSDYIRYPIRMDFETSRPTEEEGKTETVIENRTMNSMIPIWKKNKKDITEDEYNDFYMQEYYDYNKPLKTVHYSVEGNTSYTALLYIPSKAPYNYYTTDYKLGLKLYSKGVFIKDEANELVSDYFKFVRGLIDSDDLNLNISREILQQDHQMKAIKKSIDKRIKTTLEKMLENERENYETFFSEFGAQLKFGAYENYGMNKDVLIDLLMFKSSYEDKYVTLKEYVSRMKEGQKDIYYAVGESIAKIKEMPQIERVLDKGYEVLYFLENVDEFMASILMNYDEHNFKSINKGDLDLDSEEEKEKNKKDNEENKDILKTIKDILKDNVKEVKLSSRLKSHPVCLVSDDNLSIEMEKALKEMNQTDENIKANKILEINPDHEIFKSLKAAFEKSEDISDYAKVLYDQALLIAGLSIEDPVEYSNLISKIIIKSMK